MLNAIILTREWGTFARFLSQFIPGLQFKYSNSELIKKENRIPGHLRRTWISSGSPPAWSLINDGFPATALVLIVVDIFRRKDINGQ